VARSSFVVQRAERGGLVDVTAKLTGSLRDAVVRGGGTDRVAVDYERSVPAGPVRAGSLRLELGSPRRGRYVITMTSRDLLGERTVTRQREIVID